MSSWASWIVGVGRYDHLLTPPHHGASGRQYGRLHINMGVVTSLWASARRYGHWEVIGGNTWPHHNEKIR